MQKNIAILTMSLNIGGAETHIYELACALAAAGNNVTVFSAGGVYADKLEQQGVKHIVAPLNKKDIVSLCRSYRIVCDYVKNNRPCVIHSHTRISNFTAGAVARRYNIPFVSTVHFNFSTGLVQRMFTHWGDRALAVSEDLKDYAAKEYGFDRDKITVTVNGINLNTFCKNPMPEFKAQLGIAPDSKVILCVSRLDETAGDHVERVLNMARDIYGGTPDSNIIIVGGGTRYKEFCGIAEKINADTKPDFVRLIGPQTDIYRYCNIADLFIGISRSALEAMACEVPTVLLGNSGYLGLYSEKTRKACIDTNFTCRGCPYPDDGEIVSLVTDMLSHPESYADNVAGGLEIVKTRYSVLRMARDAEQSYAAAEKDRRPVDFMICGYYGRHNMGDDMALSAIIDNVRLHCGSDKTVLVSADVNEKIDGISHSVHRFDLRSIYRLMKKTDVFILGGGSLLQDATSSRSMFYYTHMCKKAVRYGCKLMLYGNGIGPILRKRNRKRAFNVLESANEITLRDRRSLVCLRSLGIENKNVHLAADETFTLDVGKHLSEYTALPDGKYICINLRDSCIGERLAGDFAAFTDMIAKKYGLIPVLLPVHYESDIDELRRISQKLHCRHVLINERISYDQTLDILKKCDVAILERLHALIFSCIFGKPFLAVNYDPKVLSFCIEMGMEDYVIGLASFNSDNVAKQFENVMKNSGQISERLIAKSTEKRELARKNIEYAARLLKDR